MGRHCILLYLLDLLFLLELVPGNTDFVDFRGGKEGNLLDPDFGLGGGREEEDVVPQRDVVRWDYFVALSRNNE